MQSYAKRKYRTARGEAHGQNRLTDDIVRECRRRFMHGESKASIARSYGVAESTIGGAISGRTWSHITEPAPIALRGAQ